nr:histidine phosphatase family protein [Fimbriimonadaceae bacterium]
TFAELFEHKAEITKKEGTPFESIVPPSGESIEMVWNRVSKVVHEILDTKENTLVVTHGGTGSLLMAQLLQGSMATARAFRFANAGVTELQLRPDGAFLIVRFNDTSHLAESPLTGGLDGSHRREA